jgi:hypothetical protein
MSIVIKNGTIVTADWSFKVTVQFQAAGVVR